MEKQTKERVELYGKDPRGDQIPINVEPFDIWDNVPDKEEIREVMEQLKNDQAGGA